MAVSGARAYVAGPAGVLCVNVHTGGKVFFQKWPDEVSAWLPKVSDAVGTAAPTPMALMGQSRTGATTSTFWEGMAKLHPGRQTTCFGMVNAVGEGRLYAVMGGGRVVAFGDKQPEGGNAGDGE